MDGAIIPLSQVPDPAFSKGLLGNGLALDSSQGLIVAPFDGILTGFNKFLHAFVITSHTIDLLVHVGLETVTLNGEGFVPLVRSGEEVSKGQPILRFDPQRVAQKALCPYTLLVVTSPLSARISVQASGVVHAGDPLFTVSLPQGNAALLTEDEYTESAPLTVRSPHGLHARPAGTFAAQASLFDYPLQLVKNGKTANAKSVLEILQLAVNEGDCVTLRVFAPQETARHILKILTPFLQDPL